MVSFPGNFFVKYFSSLLNMEVVFNFELLFKFAFNMERLFCQDLIKGSLEQYCFITCSIL